MYRAQTSMICERCAMQYFSFISRRGAPSFQLCLVEAESLLHKWRFCPHFYVPVGLSKCVKLLQKEETLSNLGAPLLNDSPSTAGLPFHLDMHI